MKKAIICVLCVLCICLTILSLFFFFKSRALERQASQTQEKYEQIQKRISYAIAGIDPIWQTDMENAHLLAQQADYLSESSAQAICKECLLLYLDGNIPAFSISSAVRFTNPDTGKQYIKIRFTDETILQFYFRGSFMSDQPDIQKIVLEGTPDKYLYFEVDD